MTPKDWIWRGALALLGSIPAAYVGSELVGGALGAALAGAIVVCCCYPLFTAILKHRGMR
jgi:glycerol uptake facilitator-like aquaporin